MRIDGNRTLAAARTRVWAALNDPAVLARVTPGCERLEPTAPDQYAVTVKVGVAAIKGSFAGTLAMTEKQEPEALVMQVSANGSAGWVKMAGKVLLAESAGGTTLTYDWDAQLGGTIAAVGQRVVAGVAKLLIDQMFARLETVLLEAAV